MKANLLYTQNRNHRMTLQKRIQSAGKLSTADLSIAQYIQSNLELIRTMTILDLAEATYTSKSAVHRFCKKIGFSGFSELKTAAADDLYKIHQGNSLEIDVNMPFMRENTCQEIAEKMMHLYESAVKDTFDFIDSSKMKKVAMLLNGASGIDIYTHAHNLNAAENFKDKMLSIGKEVTVPQGFYNQRLRVLASTPKRAALILSYSGKATFIGPVVKELAVKRTPVILIGKAGSNFYPKYFKYEINVSGKEDVQSRISQFSSHIAVEYILDVLFSCIFNLERDRNIEYMASSISFLDDRKFGAEEEVSKSSTRRFGNKRTMGTVP